MCKKYVNVTVDCFGDIESCDLEPIVFKYPFDKIITDKVCDSYRTKAFHLVTNINVLGTSDETKKKNNVLYMDDGKLDFIVRLTKCDPDTSKRSFYDLDEFQLNVKELRERNKVDGACFEFVNYSQITMVPPIDLQVPGMYVIKVLIKEGKEKDYSVQFIKKLIVN